MKKYIITIDGGTTNTRCILWDNNRNKVDEEKRAVGVRNTSIDGNNSKLVNAVKECIQELVERNHISFDEINRIIGSGMITSDVGITVVPWITAPAGLEELAAHTVAKNLPEICPLPIYFVPGIKNSEGPFSFDNIESMDIMRGEEVESIAILDDYPEGSKMLLVLPGSHNKFIAVNEKKQILGCLTSISGELLSSITNDTIIAKSVNKQFVSMESYEKEWLYKGYEIEKKTGLGRACFTARIIMLFLDNDPKKIANYVLGASVAGDIQAIKNSSTMAVDSNVKVVVGGKEPLRNAVADILKYDGYFKNVEEYIQKENISLSAKGAYLVAKKNGLL